TGVVLILKPGGEIKMVRAGAEPESGSVSADRAAPDSPAPAVTLEPFFISKYEMTQSQWLRADDSQPSEHWFGIQWNKSPRISQTNPVEHVSWDACHRVLLRWNLAIPTEAQWVTAARGGTTTRYWTGSDDPSSIAPLVNFADLALETAGFTIENG